MELSAILLLLGILIIVVLFVAQPFTSHWKVKVQSSHEMSSLLAERERTLNALQELDADQDADVELDSDLGNKDAFVSGGIKVFLSGVS